MEEIHDMKIISDFVDYYDQYQDVYSRSEPPTTYLRKTFTVDGYTALQVQRDLGIAKQKLIRFTDKISNSLWSISTFIIGVSGRINRGVEIRYENDIEHSYTFTGSLYIPKRMGIDITQEMVDVIKNHFEKPTFDNTRSFNLVGAPAFIIMPNNFGFNSSIANPCLKDFGYHKACMAGELYLRMRSFIDNIFIPCSSVQSHCYGDKPSLRICGLESSGWKLHDGLPNGY